MRIRSLTALPPGLRFAAADDRTYEVVGMAVIDADEDPGDVIAAVLVDSENGGPYFMLSTDTALPGQWPGGRIYIDE